MYFGKTPYGIEGYIEHYGDGSNMLRGQDFAQPRTLVPGDELANGWVVGEKLSGFSSSVGVRFMNGEVRVVAPRIPLQLKGGAEGVYPGDLRTGQILQTGCVVLDAPVPVDPVQWHADQEEVALKLTGGFKGHDVRVATDLPLAVYSEMYPPGPSSLLGAFTMDNVMRMDQEARSNLPQAG